MLSLPSEMLGFFDLGYLATCRLVESKKVFLQGSSPETEDLPTGTLFWRGDDVPQLWSYTAVAFVTGGGDRYSRNCVSSAMVPLRCGWGGLWCAK